MNSFKPITADHFSLILEGMYHGVVSTDAQGIIVIFNRGAERIFGYQADDILGRNLEILIPERFRAGHAAHMKAFAGQSGNSRLMGQRSQIQCLRSDGTEFPAEASIMTTEQDGEIYCTAVVRDLSDRARWEKELRSALDRAEEANRVKARLMANLSHELRTPLNAIIGFSDALLAGVAGEIAEPKITSYLKDIRMSGQHLLTLVMDLLDMSTIEAGGARPSVRKCGRRRCNSRCSQHRNREIPAIPPGRSFA